MEQNLFKITYTAFVPFCGEITYAFVPLLKGNQYPTSPILYNPG